MKCKSNVLVTKVDVKTKKDNSEKYIMVSFLDLDTGDVFNVIEKDIEVLSKVQPMKKRTGFIVNFSESKYGLKAEILDYGKEAEF